MLGSRAGGAKRKASAGKRKSLSREMNMITNSMSSTWQGQCRPRTLPGESVITSEEGRKSEVRGGGGREKNRKQVGRGDTNAVELREGGVSTEKIGGFSGESQPKKRDTTSRNIGAEHSRVRYGEGKKKTIEKSIVCHRSPQKERKGGSLDSKKRGMTGRSKVQKTKSSRDAIG